jgi:ribonuclease HII
MKSKALINYWTEWLSTSEKFLRILHEQTVAITLRDVARVERLQPDLEIYTKEIQKFDSKALSEAKRLAEELGATPNSLRSLVSVLDKSEGANLQLTANKVLATSQKIQEVISKNRKLMESEMTYINGTLTLIAKAATQEKGPYRTRKTTEKQPILVNAAA